MPFISCFSTSQKVLAQISELDLPKKAFSSTKAMDSKVVSALDHLGKAYFA